MGISSNKAIFNRFASLFLAGASLAVVLLFVVAPRSRSAGSVGVSDWKDATQMTSEAEGVVVKMTPSDEDTNQSGMAGDITSSQETDEQDIAQLVRKAANEDKTIIMTSVNDAWAAEGSLLDLLLESMRNGANTAHFINHLIIVALDPKAYERCKSLHPHCYFLKVDSDLAGDKVFMSKDYIDLVWRKVKLQQQILELGYNFLFTDVDILWFRNPFEPMSVAAHMSTSSDFYFGNPYSPFNFPNTGFIYVKSNHRNIEMFKIWHDAKDKYPGKHEQQVFNEVKFDLVAKHNMVIQFLDPSNFGGFCNNTHDFNTLYTMHANCCVGLQAKLHDLRSILSDWSKYKALPEEQRRGPVPWEVTGGICMH